MDNFVHTFCEIRKQYFMWTVNSFTKKCEQFEQSVDKIVHTWRALVNSIREQYTWAVYVNSVPIGMKVWTILFRYGQHCPHFLWTWCTVSYYPEICLYPKTCLTQVTFCKLGLQCNSYITFIKLLHSWNSPWFGYIKNLEQPTSNNSNTYALPLSLHWDHKVH